MPTAPISGAEDLVAQAHGRVVLQYRTATKLLAFIDAVLDFLQQAENTVQQISPLDDIDIATGVNLDVDGEIVGQGRELLNGDVMSDASYRILIRTRIARNQSHATDEDLIGILAQLFGSPVIVNDFGGMAVGFAITRQPTSDEVAILDGDVLPRAMGVEINPREWFDPANHFGFAPETNGDQTALPFGENNDPAPPGGKFAEAF